MPRIVADSGRKQYERHGMSSSPEYGIWATMISRCHNSNTKDFSSYGEQGIEVCSRWRDSFQAFIADVGPRPTSQHTLDRLNNSLGYQPGNVAWRTYVEQNNNKSSNRRFEIEGEQKTLQQVSDETGILRETISRRLSVGQSLENALSRPLRGKEKYVFHGRELTVHEISEETGVAIKTIRMRMSRGMDIVAASSSQSYKQSQKSISRSPQKCRAS